MDTVTRRNTARPSATLNPTFAPMSLSKSPRPTSVATTSVETTSVAPGVSDASDRSVRVPRPVDVDHAHLRHRSSIDKVHARHPDPDKLPTDCREAAGRIHAAVGCGRYCRVSLTDERTRRGQLKFPALDRPEHCGHRCRPAVHI